MCAWAVIHEVKYFYHCRLSRLEIHEIYEIFCTFCNFLAISSESNAKILKGPLKMVQQLCTNVIALEPLQLWTKTVKINSVVVGSPYNLIGQCCANRIPTPTLSLQPHWTSFFRPINIVPQVWLWLVHVV